MVSVNDKSALPEPMEILLLEMKYGKKQTVGFVDFNYVWHELSPYQSGGNNNELRPESVIGWSYLWDELQTKG